MIDISPANRFHELGVSADLYGCTIHRQVFWYPVIRYESWESRPNLFVVDSVDVIVSVESTFVEEDLTCDVAF